MVHQDTARTDIVDSIQEDSVLITQDFAMKFLPAHYRETQAEFFGKRGISWHLTVCQSKQGGELVAQTFVHIIESGLQDSHTVVTVIEHVLKTSGVNESGIPPRQRRMLPLRNHHTSMQITARENQGGPLLDRFP